MKLEIKPEIQEGSLVELDSHGHPDVRAKIEQWRKAYDWPMKVFRRLSEHVYLQDGSRKIIRFGSTNDPSFSIHHVKLCQ